MPRKDRPRHIYPCRATCPGGNPCVCDTWPGSTHHMHICRKPDCFCHSKERWEPARKRKMKVIDPRTDAIHEIHMDLETYDNLIDLIDVIGMPNIHP